MWIFWGEATFGTVTVEGTQVGDYQELRSEQRCLLVFLMTAASLIRLDSTLDIDLSQGSLSKAGVAFTDVTNL